MSIWLPLNPAAGVTADAYTVVTDYTPTDASKRTTTIEVTTDGDPERAKLVVAFPGELWFRQTGGDEAGPTGDVVLMMQVGLAGRLSRGASVFADELGTLFCYEGVTIQRDAWVASLHAALDQAKKRRQQSPSAAAIKLSDLAPAQIFDLFAQGLVSIPVGGGEDLPIDATTLDDPPRFRFSLCSTSWPDAGANPMDMLAPTSPGGIIQWSRTSGNLAEPIYTHPLASAIPVGYFYAETVRADFGPNHADHPLLRALLGEPDAGWGTATGPFRDYLGAITKQWRAFVMTTNYTPRLRPALWLGWVGQSLEIDGSEAPIDWSGRIYWKLASGDVTVRLLKQGTEQSFRRPQEAALSTRLDVTIDAGTYTYPLVVDVPTPSFLVKRRALAANPAKRIPDTAPYEGHVAPSDLTADDQPYLYAVYATLAGYTLGEVCPGRSNRAVQYEIRQTPTFQRFGMNEFGVVMPGDVLASQGDYFADRGWESSQSRVLAAVSPNEGNCDAINTWDNAFLSVGILQWAAYVGGQDQSGELPGFLAFLDLTDPALFAEYFGRHNILYTGLRANFPDRIPRALLQIDSIPIDGTATLMAEHLRDYEIAMLFKAAAADPAYQRLQLEFAYERLKILRDQLITLSADNSQRPVSELFTSELAVALITDQHTNRPRRVAANLHSAIGPRLPDAGGAYSRAQLNEILDSYQYAREMDSPKTRAGRIYKYAPALDPEPGTFQWPAGPRNAWLPAGVPV